MVNVCVGLDSADLEEFALLAHNIRRVLQENNAFVTMGTFITKEDKLAIKISVHLIQFHLKLAQINMTVNVHYQINISIHTEKFVKKYSNVLQTLNYSLVIRDGSAPVDRAIL